MNELRHHPDRESEEVARLGAIVRQHALPNFVTSFDFRLGEFEGDPAVWVVFRTNQDLPSEEMEADRWVEEANALATGVREHIIDSGEVRFPFVRFEVGPQPADDHE